METSEPSHSRPKRDAGDSLEGKESRVDEDEEWDGSDKRKRRSANKSRQHDDEERETGKRKSSGEKDDGRRKSGVSSRADSGDEDDYDVRRELRPKGPKKNPEDRNEKKSGDGYRERESESSRKVRGEESERSSSRKTSVKTSGHDSSQSRSKNKADGSHESELEKMQAKDSSERKDSHRDRGHSSRRRWDETDSGRKAEESSYTDTSDPKGGKGSDHSKQGSSKERKDSRNDPADSAADRIDERRLDGDNTRGRQEVKDDEKPRKYRDRSVERSEKHKHQQEARHRSRDDADIREKSSKVDDDGYGRSRDKSARESKESRRSKKSRSPERKHYKELDDADRGLSDSDNEKNRDRDGHRDARSSKGKDVYRDNRSREHETSKDRSRRSHAGRHDRENKDRDVDYDYDKDYDPDKYHSRSTHRKESRGRNEATKVNDHSDPTETRQEGSVSNASGRRAEGGMALEFPLGVSDEEWIDNRSKGEDTQERYGDDSSLEAQGSKGRATKTNVGPNRAGIAQVVGSGLQPPFGNNQGLSSSVNRNLQQGAKAGRSMRGGRGRLPGRDGQRGTIQLSMLGPFGHLGLPSGGMSPIGPNMSPSPGPPIGPGVFLPGFPHVVWQGGRGIDMNMLGVPPTLSPLPPGPSGPRFPPGMPAGPSHGMYFNQPGMGRGLPINTPGHDFSAMGPMNRGLPGEKLPGGWNPPRIGGPPGKAPSRGEQNDYSQNFVDTGMRPQNFIRELELTSVVEDYPKLRELIQKKDEIVANSATPPMYYKCDLHDFVLSPEFFGTKFDVILVDPPWEEYVHRAPGVSDHMESWTFEDIQNLKIEAIADTPSFIFLWVGDGVGLEQGRQCLKKWGFRRCEDICWVKTNKTNAAPSLRHDSHTLFQHSKEHCLMGIKGTVRRSTDGHIIHANIDTDVIIAEEPPYGSTTKPEDLYRIIEHFSLGRRRIELFGEDHNIRAGWVTLGKDLSSSNFNKEAYCKNFADKDGKVWVGGGGRNPPLDAPHLVVTTPDIENLRPKSPPQKNQQVQSTSLSTTASSGKRVTVNSPQNLSSMSSVLILNQEVPGSNPNPPGLLPWTAPPPMLGSFKASEAGSSSAGGSSDDKFFDGYPPIFTAPPAGDALDFDPQPPVNL